MKIICMKCQILFSEKNKQNNINLSSAGLTQRVVKVNSCVSEGPCRLRVIKTDFYLRMMIILKDFY